MCFASQTNDNCESSLFIKHTLQVIDLLFVI